MTSAAYWLEAGEKRPGSRAIAAALRSCGPAYAAAGQAHRPAAGPPAAAVGYGLVASTATAARRHQRLPAAAVAASVLLGRLQLRA